MNQSLEFLLLCHPKVHLSFGCGSLREALLEAVDILVSPLAYIVERAELLGEFSSLSETDPFKNLINDLLI